MKGYDYDIQSVVNIDLPWNKLANTNILVTGATGLIGSTLVKVLLSKEDLQCQVYASGRNKDRANALFAKYLESNNYHFIQYDVLQPLSGEVQYDYIAHCASGAAPKEFVEHPVEVMKANFGGVSNLLDYGARHRLKRFLYISSGEVYGEGDGCTFTEDYNGYVNITSPRSCYPSSKRAAETLCVSYMEEYGIDVVIARPCHIYGPHFTENDNRVYAQFIRNVLRDENIIMKSTGEQFRSWCYVVDCVSALLYILLKGESGQAYNIADDSSNISIKELAEMIADLAGKKVIINIPSDKEKSGYNVVNKSIYSTKKLKELGWNVGGNMRDKMKKTIKESSYSIITNPQL